MTSATTNSNPKAYRLPLTVRPRHYEITLDARPGRETFSGSLAVQVSIAAPTNTIELHARDLTITNARLVSPNGQTFAASVAPDAEREIVTLTLDGTAPAGGATLSFDFTGSLSPSLEGL
ncbi:MAG TPA: hypothetical protein VF120_01485, partial [Ktedonobacterales bacterium]